ncbi:uncharacterized protein LOC130700553 isoform X2 [Daphnia carinata]|uniref:uncharacterized protein LOC130700553 isoform X2 n=1 Tax=Daphnia carinata TaxID=120202 RepID=UPI00286954B8|nr:uncharacterized protein LOC130700553 isoform X2 [Daphnia carinata]
MAASLPVVCRAAAAVSLAAVMASVTALIADKKSGQCVRRLVHARRPHRPAGSSDQDGRLLNSNNNNNNNDSMNNRIDSVIVSDTGPPLRPAPTAGRCSEEVSARSNPSFVRSRTKKKMTTADGGQPLCGQRLDRHSVRGHSQRHRPHGWLLPVLVLSIVLSALPNSCSSAASIHHHHQQQQQQQQQQPQQQPQEQSAAAALPAARSRTPSSGRHRPPTISRSGTSSSSSSSNLLSQCPWMQWEPQLAVSDASAAAAHEADVAGTRAYMAPVVFEGKARSRSDGPVYRVTFDVVTVYKGEVATGSQVRLEFKSGAAAAATTTAHQSTASHSKQLRSLSRNAATTRSRTLSAARRTGDVGSAGAGAGASGQRRRQPGQQHHRRHQHHSARQCLVTAEIRTGRRYLVFAAHWGPNNFTAYGSPLVHTKKSLKDVRSTLCPRCARSPVAYGLEESVTVKKQQRLILRCRTRGNPVPGVTWFKDGKPLNSSNKRVRIKTKRRRSTLRIRCVKEEDAGLYECRPNNVIGSGTASRSKVTVVKVTAGPSSDLSSKLTATNLRPVNGSSSSSLWPLIALPCPIDSFCLNGGTCKYYEAVGELVCQCAEGYKGQRCENKDIYNLGTDTLGGVEADMRTLALYLGK